MTQVSPSISILALLLLVVSIISAKNTNISRNDAEFSNTNVEINHIAQLFPVHESANINETAFLYKQLTRYLMTDLIYAEAAEKAVYFTLQQELRRHVVDFSSALVANLFNGNVFPFVKETEDYCSSIIKIHDVSMAVAIYKKAIDEIYEFQPVDILANYLRTLLRNDAKNLRVLIELQLYLYWKFMNSHQVNDAYLLHAGYYFHELQQHPRYYQLKNYDYQRRLEVAISSLPTSVQNLYFQDEVCFQNKKNKQFLYIDGYKLDKESHPVLTHPIRNYSAGDWWHVHVRSGVGKTRESLKVKHSFVSALNHLKLSYKHRCEHFLNIASGSSLPKNTEWVVELVNNDLVIKMNEYVLCAANSYFKNVSHVVLLTRPKKRTLAQPSNCRWRVRERPRRRNIKTDTKDILKLGVTVPRLGGDKHFGKWPTRRIVGTFFTTTFPSNLTKSLQSAGRTTTLQKTSASNRTYNIKNSDHCGQFIRFNIIDSPPKDNSSSSSTRILNDVFVPPQNITEKAEFEQSVQYDPPNIETLESISSVFLNLGQESKLIKNAGIANNQKSLQSISSQKLHDEVKKYDGVSVTADHFVLANVNGHLMTGGTPNRTSNFAKGSPAVLHSKTLAAVNESTNTETVRSFDKNNKNPDNTAKTSVQSLGCLSSDAVFDNSTLKTAHGIIKKTMIEKEGDLLKRTEKKINNDGRSTENPSKVDLASTSPSGVFGVPLKKAPKSTESPQPANTGKKTATNEDSEDSDYESDDTMEDNIH